MAVSRGAQMSHPELRRCDLTLCRSSRPAQGGDLRRRAVDEGLYRWAIDSGRLRAIASRESGGHKDAARGGEGLELHDVPHGTGLRRR